ncbi:MAG: Mut7-C RNAse domain-containing protein, partial [Candidatus Zixiibacteriota bacterium]
CPYFGCGRGATMRFICDDNLGKLAKWLRTLGYDTLFFDPIEDGELVARALKEDRVVLSRDTQLSRFKFKLGENLIRIESDKPLKQLKQVLHHFNLKPDKELLLSRCSVCNEPLQKVQKEKIKDRLYPYVYKTQDCFVHCPKCDRIYWSATHVARMTKTLSDHKII